MKDKDLLYGIFLLGGLIGGRGVLIGAIIDFIREGIAYFS